jgi:hypothetical protein
VAPLEYHETRADNRTVYDETNVTLHPVQDGNARIDRIDASKFNLSKLVRTSERQ